MRTRRRFGQHFLERPWAERLVRAIGPKPGELFVEIGAGRGALTIPLAGAGADIIAIEIDRDLAAELASHVPPNVRVLGADVLEVDLPRELKGRRARVAGNLPYNISSPVLFRLLDWKRSADCVVDATLMLQREVADRVTAVPSTGDYGPLAILISLHADVQRLFTLPPGAFRPPPKVHSAVVRLSFRQAPAGLADERVLESMVRAMFMRRRKTLLNALASFGAARAVDPALALKRAGVDPRRRPETLQMPEVLRLATEFVGEGRRPRH